jgi:hypothetical protein
METKRPDPATPEQYAASLDRYWGSADRVYLTTWRAYGEDDGATLHFRWSDGAALDIFEDTETNARETLRRLGFTE